MRLARRSLVEQLDGVVRDARYAARSLRRDGASTAVAVAILALGIGANLTIFRFVSALLLQPPPVEAPGRLLQVWNANPRGGSVMERHVPLSYPGYAHYRDANTAFAGVLAFEGDPHMLSWVRGGRGETVQAQFVSGNFFTLLGVRAALGSTTLPADDAPAGGMTPLVISDRFWRRSLGGSGDVVGTTVVLNGVPFTVAGVAPPGFAGMLAGLAPDVWVPLAAADAVRHERGLLSSHTSYWLFAVGRLRPGVAPERAEAEVRTLARRFRETEAAPDGAGYDVAVYPATLVPGPVRRTVGLFVALLQTVVTLVLLIACANAATLLLARAAARRPALAVRAALGASRARLARQVLVQTVLLGLLAGGFGLLVALAAGPLLLRLLPPTLPIRLGLATDWRVVAFCVVTAAGTGLLVGLAPALRDTRDLTGALRRERLGGRRTSRLRDALVVTQVAVSLVLLVAGALCWRSLSSARSVDPGFAVRDRVAVQIDLRSLGYSDTAGRAFQRALLDRVSALPGVARASTTQYLPLSTTRLSVGVKVPGVDPPAGERAHQVQSFDVGGGYFTTMGTRLLRGREINWRDDERAPRVVVVNEAMAARFWPDADPVGRVVTLDTGVDEAPYEVVGVVATGKYHHLAERPRPVVFRAERQTYRPRLTVVAQVRGAPPAAVIAAIRAEVARLDPNLVATGATLEEHLHLALFPARAAGVALGIAGGLGLALALVGLAAVVAQSVAQRTREIGIRMALGARAADVVRQVVGEGARLLGVGVAIGAVLALGASQTLAGLLYGVTPTDPATYVGVTALLVASALGACAVVARRAAAVDPVVAIRSE